MNNLKNITWKGFRERPLVMDVLWKDEVESLPVVIFAHGYKGFKDWGAWNLMASRFAEAGFLFIKFNFSFNGGTVEQPIDFPDLKAFGENNYSTEIGDLKRAVDFVYESDVIPRDKIDLNNITVIGHSRGGGMAILTTAQEERINKLITLASICDLDRRQPKGKVLEDCKKRGVLYVKNSRTAQLMPHYYQMQEDYIANKEKFDIGKAAKNMTIPWLIVHGDADKTVSISEAEELLELNPKVEYKVISSGDHVFGAKHPWESDQMPEDLDNVIGMCLEFIAD